ncbi:outer membrane autotransporter barrel domain-containing protein [Pseudomonas sp. ok272]|uniref:autotransporter outer membrane beta-barrel domain-containing protein n=1 Tax=unclassified Pseudomonas TaxID=196821 RepID=UPI0008AD14AC|nr:MULTISPECIES: autotransporter outer membrane beta-barrel domain-containing protein [unclassified Pseudomonas]SEM61311.1 outer membrane autotransporter barrel domain-containing protein [Pseudomonas sp. ok272]SFM48976.1 outer membrane autotransporter barrel domain-containing protein [Pseudomonas sp. ok602]
MPAQHQHRPQLLALAIALALGCAESTLADPHPATVETPHELISRLDAFIADPDTVQKTYAKGIKAKGGVSVQLGDTNDLVIVQPRGSFAGLVDGGGGDNVLQLDSANGGTLGETRNFAGLEVKQGHWARSGAGDFSTGVLVRPQAQLTNNGNISGHALTQGTLSNNGAIANGAQVLAGGVLTNQGTIGGAVDVLEGGRFSGRGAVDALNVQGELSVGNVSGAPTVTRDLKLSPSAVLAYAVDASGNSPTIVVKGTAELNDATLKLVTSGDYPQSSQHTILEAGSVQGTFARVDNDLPFMDHRLQYEEQRVGLTYTRNEVPLESAADTDNSRELAKSIEEPQGTAPPAPIPPETPPAPQSPVEPRAPHAPTPEPKPAPAAKPTPGSPATHASRPAPGSRPTQAPKPPAAPGPDSAHRLLGAMLTSNKATAALGFEQLAAESNANLAKATLGSVSPVNTSLLSAMRQLNTPHGLGSVSRAPRQAAAGETGRVWLQALGHAGNVDRDFASTLQHNTQGLVMGIDWRADDQWRIGVMGGKSQTRLDAKWLDGSLDSWHLGAYAVHQSGPMALRLGATLASHDGSSTRQVAFNGFRDSPKGSYSASTQHLFAETGFNLGTNNLTFEPFANLGYQRYQRDSYTEKGGAAALKVYGQTQDNLSTTFGLRLASLNTLDNGLQLTPRLSAGWKRTYGDLEGGTRQRLVQGGKSFEVYGALLDRDSLSLDLGLDLGLSAGHTLGVGVTGEIGTDSRSHGVMGQWRMAF